MDALKACGNRYVSDNSWHKWGDQHRYSMDAFKLYHRASTSALGWLLLGSGKIRFDDGLLGNFGMTSGSGTDDKMLEKVQALQAQRTAMRTAPGMRDVPNVVGPGSILSDRNWSPLLNDSYILGGVHAGCEFHFAEDAASAEFATMPVQLTPAQKWQAFIKKHPETFWDDKNHLPRVLSRELIGLKTFGYRPEFSVHQLSFRPTGSGDATFIRYLEALAAGGYTGKDRVRMFDALALFLFGTVAALR
jgi:hypothetical protein